MQNDLHHFLGELPKIERSPEAVNRARERALKRGAVRMYIKFLAHGKGDPAKAASYLIDEVDHLNRPRADVQVLRGDPHTFTAIAESIENDWKYTSGVIAWSKDDVPTNEEIDQVLEAFEKHAFAGVTATSISLYSSFA